MTIRMEEKRLWGICISIAVAAIVAAWIFFEFQNLTNWMAFNNPFQSQWAAVQLADGEVVYGHLAGVSASTIGLTDVYILDKVNAEEGAGAIVSSSDFSIGQAAEPQLGQALVPVTYTDRLYLDRAAVLYFRFVPPGDPALPYLR